MAQFKTIVEAVLRNRAGGELSRCECEPSDSEPDYYVLHYYVLPDTMRYTLSPGDTITLEERETEIE